MVMRKGYWSSLTASKIQGSLLNRVQILTMLAVFFLIHCFDGNDFVQFSSLLKIIQFQEVPLCDSKRNKYGIQRREKQV